MFCVTRPAQSLDAPSNGAATTLTALVVGTDDWAIEQSAEALAAAGHRVRRCHAPGEPMFPCFAVQIPGGCPVDRGIDVVVVVRARASQTPEVGEFGAICALRAGVPLVAAGISRNSPFTRHATAEVGERGDLVEEVEHAVAAARTVIELPNQISDDPQVEQ